MRFIRKLFSGLAEWALIAVFAVLVIIFWPLIRAGEEAKDE